MHPLTFREKDRQGVLRDTGGYAAGVPAAAVAESQEAPSHRNGEVLLVRCRRGQLPGSTRAQNGHIRIREVVRTLHSDGNADVPISFWRTASGFEVDFVLGDFAMAIEVKAGQRVHDGDLAPLRALRQEHTVKNAVVVCMETTPRTTADGIRIVPWRTFLDEIWQGDLVG
jgi:hypothetical protein